MSLLNKILLYAFALLSFSISVYKIDRFIKPEIYISKEKNKNNFQENFYTFFHLGNKRLISKIIWLNTLITSDLEKVQNNNSWMFYNFKSIQNLDPFFYSNYKFSTLYLSVVKNDIDGTNYFINLSKDYYPDDYDLNFFAGVHFLFEVNNLKNALYHFEKIINHPRAPAYLKSLIAKIYAENDNPFIGLNLLIEASKNDDLPEYLKKHFNETIYSIKASIDLNCLNIIKKNCENFDYFGNRYIYQDGKYTSKLKFKGSKINIPDYYKKIPPNNGGI